MTHNKVKKIKSAAALQFEPEEEEKAEVKEDLSIEEQKSPRPPTSL